jgi:hypothetical protein
MLALLMVENKEKYGRRCCQDVHIRFCENPFVGSEFIGGLWRLVN